MRHDMHHATLQLFQPSEDDAPLALSSLHFPMFPPPLPPLLPRQLLLHRPSSSYFTQPSGVLRRPCPAPRSTVDSGELATSIYGGIGNSSIREHGSQ
jgi:hypothetical protein